MQNQTTIDNQIARKATNVLAIGVAVLCGAIFVGWLAQAVTGPAEEDQVLQKLEAAYQQEVTNKTLAGENLKKAIEIDEAASESLCRTRDALRAYKEMQGYEVLDQDFTCDFTGPTG